MNRNNKMSAWGCFLRLLILLPVTVIAIKDMNAEGLINFQNPVNLFIILCMVLFDLGLLIRLFEAIKNN